jgi:hypothetical protein
MTTLEALAKIIPQKDWITHWGVTREEIEKRLQRYDLEVEPERLTYLLEYFIQHGLVEEKGGRYLQVKGKLTGAGSVR